MMYSFWLYDESIFYELYMLGGDTMVFVSFIVSCFTCDTLVIDLYYEVIMVYVFYFQFCEIKNFVLFYLYFPHMRLCIC